MEALKLLVRVIISLLSMLMISSCSQGWRVGNYQITPQDTVTNTVFIEIMDVDSNMHYYHGRLNTESNWCWKHNQFEDVVK